MSATVSILGNVGRAPETRMTPDGTFVATFSIASNSVRNSPSGKVEKTDWFRVTAFGNQGRTLAKYAAKGTRLLVQGKLSCEPWMGRDGIPQVGADVVLQDFQFAGGGSDKDERSSSRSAASSTSESVEYEQEADFTHPEMTGLPETDNAFVN